MWSKDVTTKAFTALASAIALALFAWSLLTVDPEQIGVGVGTLAALTVFCSYFLRFKVPGTDIHLTLSDGLVLVCVLMYGGPIAVLLATVSEVLGTLHSRKRGSGAGAHIVLVNSSFATIAVFAAATVASTVFGPFAMVLERQDMTSFVWLVGSLAVSLVLINTVLSSVYASLKTARSIGKVISEKIVEAGAIYLTGGIVAGLLFSAVEKTNIFLVAAVIGFFGIVYLTFRHFINDVKSTVENAKRSELQRAEEAERNVGQLQNYVAELEQSTEALQESHERFRHAAYHDSLTGLPNRNYFLDTLKELLQKTVESSESNFAVLFLDLKSFKTINDSLGHSLGDRLIKNVAQRLSSMVREDDLVGRFSGDKFGIILTDLLTRDEATGFADRLAKRLAEPYTLDGRQVFTSAKIGIAYGNSKYPEAEDILRDADIAMYYAKDNAENYVIFDQRMHIRAVTRLQLETDLRFAIERNEFELFYQPIISLEKAGLVGFEALVRWNHPQRGLIPPNEFIPVSESTGLIVPMTVKILHSACDQVVKWQRASQMSQPLSVAVNLSGKHFGHPALVEQINTIIAETGIDPASLKLELTESAVMENAETAILMLKEIKKTGVQISIDDFGTGYSSLSYLHRFPIDLLKVDRSFVSAMEENSENGEIVRTVIALAKALNLKVVAEGIESIHQYHQLKVLGCEYGQGYLFSKPLPVHDIERLLSDTSRWKNILPTADVAAPPTKLDLTHLRLTQ
jgi:diguanylate cyclase (GGDEF)-like protein